MGRKATRGGKQLACASTSCLVWKSVAHVAMGARSAFVSASAPSINSDTNACASGWKAAILCLSFCSKTSDLALASARSCDFWASCRLSSSKLSLETSSPAAATSGSDMAALVVSGCCTQLIRRSRLIEVCAHLWRPWRGGGLVCYRLCRSKFPPAGPLDRLTIRAATASRHRPCQ